MVADTNQGAVAADGAVHTPVDGVQDINDAFLRVRRRHIHLTGCTHNPLLRVTDGKDTRVRLCELWEIYRQQKNENININMSSSANKEYKILFFKACLTSFVYGIIWSDHYISKLFFFSLSLIAYCACVRVNLPQLV